MLLGPAVARGLNKPAISLMLQPLASPTREFPAALLPPLSLPGWMNRLTYRLPKLLLEQLYGRATRAARRSLFGIADRTPLWHGGPVLYGFSASLVRRPADWVERHEICGAWNFPAEHWHAPADLEAFLAAGVAALVCGFRCAVELRSRQGPGRDHRRGGGSAGRFLSGVEQDRCVHAAR